MAVPQHRSYQLRLWLCLGPHITGCLHLSIAKTFYTYLRGLAYDYPLDLQLPAIPMAISTAAAGPGCYQLCLTTRLPGLQRHQLFPWILESFFHECSYGCHRGSKLRDIPMTIPMAC